MIKDLAGIKLTSPMIAEYTDSDNVSVDIKVDGDSGEAVYNYNGESYAYESYTFTGAYTTGMVYDIDFVGIVIPSYVTYEVEPESGYITRPSFKGMTKCSVCCPRRCTPRMCTTLLWNTMTITRTIPVLS